MRFEWSHSCAFSLIFTVKTSTSGIKSGSRPSWKELSSAYAPSLHFLLEILSNSILHFHWPIALYKLTAFCTLDFHSLLFSAVGLFIISVNWRKPISQTGVLRRRLCRCPLWQPAGIQPAAPGPILLTSWKLEEALPHLQTCTGFWDAFLLWSLCT